APKETSPRASSDWITSDIGTLWWLPYLTTGCVAEMTANQMAVSLQETAAAVGSIADSRAIKNRRSPTASRAKKPGRAQRSTAKPRKIGATGGNRNCNFGRANRSWAHSEIFYMEWQISRSGQKFFGEKKIFQAWNRHRCLVSTCRSMSALPPESRQR